MFTRMNAKILLSTGEQYSKSKGSKSKGTLDVDQERGHAQARMQIFKQQQQF